MSHAAGFYPLFRHFDMVASGPASLPKIRPPTIHINAFPTLGAIACAADTAVASVLFATGSRRTAPETALGQRHPDCTMALASVRFGVRRR